MFGGSVARNRGGEVIVDAFEGFKPDLHRKSHRVLIANVQEICCVRDLLKDGGLDSDRDRFGGLGCF